MIIDLQRFIASERPCWSELERAIDKLEADPNHKLSLDGLRRFHLLYERTAADLAKITTFSAEPETRHYLENLVARAYGEIRGTLEKQRRLIGNNDLWIGAHAIALEVTLATNNEREFKRIAGLSVENWTK